jgi:tRNA G10  N-methylase Trm11
MDTIFNYLFGLKQDDNLVDDNFKGGSSLDKDKIAKKIKNITEEEAIKDYEHLKEINLKKVTNETRIGNKFVDYFTFRQRLETIGVKGFSYFEFIKDTEYHKKKYIKHLLDYQKGDDKHVALYRVFKLHAGSIGLFKPLTSMDIYSRFKPTSVLDPCMGWGGRLVGACALDIPNYIGIDTNKSLKEPYQKMSNLLKRLRTKTKIKLMFKDALKVDYSKLHYDCVLTSPPYYNLEIYEDSTFKTDEEWETDFYIPLFTNTYKHLKKGGHYILNIPNDLYKNVCIELLGKADIKIPLKKKAHPKKKSSDKDYTEFLYVWKKE